MRHDGGDQLRVALVHTSNEGGGAERSVVSLHRALRRLGHESTLLVGRSVGEEPGMQEIPYLRGPPGLRRLARGIERHAGWQDIYNPSFRGLGRILQADLDVVHFHSLWGASGYADLAALPALTARTPGVITMRENWLVSGHCACFFDCDRWQRGCGDCPDLTIAPSIQRDGTRFNFARKRRLLRRSDVHVVAISRWLASVAQRSPILEGKAISWIHNGIDLDTFAPRTHSDRAALRAKFGIAEGAFVVLLAGQTVEGIRTGIATRYAIDALGRVAGNELIPLVVGHSAERVAALLEEQGVHGAVKIGFRSTPAEMAACFAAADVTLVTSEYEAFGRIGAESQATGTPVVTMRVGGIPEVVEHEVGGLLVEPGDVDGLAHALSRLQRDRRLLARLGEGGRRYVETHFDELDVARRYVELYRRLRARRV